MDYSSLKDFKAMIQRRDEITMKALGQPPPEIIQTELLYPTEDGSQIRAKLYQPASPPKQGSPLIVMYHGGGFCIGAPEGEEQTCRNFVQAFGAVCISAAYRLAPQFRFPQGPKDAWNALQWAVANAQSWGADPTVGFVVGGTSAGGNIAAVLAHVARDEDLSPPLTGQYLAIPVLLPPSKVPHRYKPYALSYEQNKAAPILPVAALDMFMHGYKPDENDGVWFAPFNHPKGHAGLPPAYFQIAGMDPLRDEALMYERVLAEDYGVKTMSDVYPGMSHGFWGFFPFLKASEKFRWEQVRGMGWLLGREPDYSKVLVKAVAATV